MKGSIQKRGKKYYVITYQGVNEKGKAKQKWYSGFETYEEAEEFLSTIQPQLQSYKSLETFVKSFLDMKRTRVRPGTFRSYEWLATNYIVPQLGKMKIHQLTPLDIQKFYDRLLNEQVISSQSVLHVHRLLNQVLKTAHRYRLVKENVCELVDAPHANRPEIKFWDSDTLSKFLDVSSKSRYYVGYVLLAFTGMRMGEMTGLKWADIDFPNGIASIRRSWSYTGHGYRFEQPKTASGKRPIALSAFVLGTLQRHLLVQERMKREAGDKWMEQDIILATTVGTPHNHSNIRTDFYNVCRQYNLPRIRVHDLRHTHATLLLQQGVHPKVVQERLGHSDIQLTLNTYTHLLPQLQTDAALAFEGALRLNRKDDILKSISARSSGG